MLKFVNALIEQMLLAGPLDDHVHETDRTPVKVNENTYRFTTSHTPDRYVPGAKVKVYTITVKETEETLR